MMNSGHNAESLLESTVCIETLLTFIERNFKEETP